MNQGEKSINIKHNILEIISKEFFAAGYSELWGGVWEGAGVRNRTNIYRGNQPQTSLSGRDGQTEDGSGEYKILERRGGQSSQFGN